MTDQRDREVAIGTRAFHLCERFKLSPAPLGNWGDAVAVILMAPYIESRAPRSETPSIKWTDDLRLLARDKHAEAEANGDVRLARILDAWLARGDGYRPTDTDMDDLEAALADVEERLAGR